MPGMLSRYSRVRIDEVDILTGFVGSYGEMSSSVPHGAITYGHDLVSNITMDQTAQL